MKTLRERLMNDFQVEEARYAYVEDFLNASIAAQIKNLREDREMSQQDLAEKTGTKQSGISRLENVNYDAWKVETLRKLARAFGVRLKIRFEEFGPLIHEIDGFGKDLIPRKFEDDPVFQAAEEKPELEPEEVLALVSPSDFLTGTEVYAQAAREVTWQYSQAWRVLGSAFMPSEAFASEQRNLWIEALKSYIAAPEPPKILAIDQPPKTGIQDANNSNASGAVSQQYKGNRVVSIDCKKTNFSRNRSAQKRRAAK